MQAPWLVVAISHYNAIISGCLNFCRQHPVPCALHPVLCTGNSNLTRSDCLTEVGNPGHPLASLLEKG